MGSQEPNKDPIQDQDDSGCVEDGPSEQPYVGQAHILDLSDDVLLCILRLCSPRDLKALGHTCRRLGLLICDHTLWQRVDARATPIGLERMRWLLNHCLSPATQELQVTGYVDRHVRCLGIQEQTFPLNGGLEPAPTGIPSDLNVEHFLLRMWYPNLPRSYAMSPRWPDRNNSQRLTDEQQKNNNNNKNNVNNNTNNNNDARNTLSPISKFAKVIEDGAKSGASTSKDSSSGDSGQSEDNSVSNDAPSTSGASSRLSSVADEDSGGPSKKRRIDSDENSNDPAKKSSDSSGNLSDPPRKSSNPSRNTSDPTRKLSNPNKKSSDPAKLSSDPAKKLSNPAIKSSGPPKKPSGPAKKSSDPARKSSDPAKKSTVPAKKARVPDKNSSDPDKNSSDDKKSMWALRRTNKPGQNQVTETVDRKPVKQGCQGPTFTLNSGLLKVLRSKCQNLTSLSLEYCNLDYKNTNLRHFPPKLKKLSLKGSRCYNLPLSTSYLGKIQDRLPELEDLDISECDWFDPASLMPLSKVPKLRRLLMQNCRRLTECVAYASLATRYGFQELRHLDMRGSPVADSEVSAFGWLPVLEELYVSPPGGRTAIEHSHKWDEVFTPHNELEPWEADEPEYYRCKSPPDMDEDEDQNIDGEPNVQEHQVMLGNYINCASLERRIIVIHPTRQNEPQQAGRQANAVPQVAEQGVQQAGQEDAQQAAAQGGQQAAAQDGQQAVPQAGHQAEQQDGQQGAQQAAPQAGQQDVQQAVPPAGNQGIQHGALQGGQQAIRQVAPQANQPAPQPVQQPIQQGAPQVAQQDVASPPVQQQPPQQDVQQPANQNAPPPIQEGAPQNAQQVAEQPVLQNEQEPAQQDVQQAPRQDERQEPQQNARPAPPRPARRCGLISDGLCEDIAAEITAHISTTLLRRNVNPSQVVAALHVVRQAIEEDTAHHQRRHAAAVADQRANEQAAQEVDQQVVPQADQQVAPQVDQQVAPQADQQVASKADQQVAPQADQHVTPLADQQVAPQADQQVAPQADQQVAPQADLQAALQADQQVAPQAPEVAAQAVQQTGAQAGAKRPNADDALDLVKRPRLDQGPSNQEQEPVAGQANAPINPNQVPQPMNVIQDNVPMFGRNSAGQNAYAVRQNAQAVRQNAQVVQNAQAMPANNLPVQQQYAQYPSNHDILYAVGGLHNQGVPANNGRQFAGNRQAAGQAADNGQRVQIINDQGVVYIRQGQGQRQPYAQAAARFMPYERDPMEERNLFEDYRHGLPLQARVDEHGNGYIEYAPPDPPDEEMPPAQDRGVVFVRGGAQAIIYDQGDNILNVNQGQFNQVPQNLRGIAGQRVMANGGLQLPRAVGQGRQFLGYQGMAENGRGFAQAGQYNQQGRGYAAIQAGLRQGVAQVLQGYNNQVAGVNARPGAGQGMARNNPRPFAQVMPPADYARPGAGVQGDIANGGVAHVDVAIQADPIPAYQPAPAQVAPQAGVHQVAQAGVHQVAQAGVHQAAQAGVHQAAQAGVHQVAQAGVHQAAQAGVHQAAQAGVHQAAQAGVHQAAPAGVHQMAQAGVHQVAQAGVHQVAQAGVHQAAQAAVPQARAPQAVENQVPPLPELNLGDMDDDFGPAAGFDDDDMAEENGAFLRLADRDIPPIHGVRGLLGALRMQGRQIVDMGDGGGPRRFIPGLLGGAAGALRGRHRRNFQGNQEGRNFILGGGPDLFFNPDEVAVQMRPLLRMAHNGQLDNIPIREIGDIRGELLEVVRNVAERARPHIRRHAAERNAQPQPERNAQRPNEQANANRRGHPLMHIDVDIHRQNLPRVPANIAPQLVSDSAILRFGRADNDNINYVHIGHNIHGNEPGMRPDRSNLRVLSVRGYRSITDRSLEHLATAAPHLRLVDFSGTSVTARGVEMFKAIRPNCEVIFGPITDNDQGNAN